MPGRMGIKILKGCECIGGGGGDLLSLQDNQGNLKIGEDI